MMRRRSAAVVTVALITLGSGILNLVSVLIRAVPGRMHQLEDLFPLEFLHLSRFLTVLLGFALVVSSINILRRKSRAFRGVLIIASLSAIFHILRGPSYLEALVSLALVGALVATRHEFRVKSGAPDLESSLMRLGISVALVLGYSILGFWSLDRRDFGVNFHIGDAVRTTFEFLSLQGDPGMIPHTRHARWFLDSLYVISATAVAYSVLLIFRPAVYRFATLPRERALAGEILAHHGRSSLDYFKTWPDKSFFFSPSQETFIAYRVADGVAVALADPVGPEPEIETTIRAFRGFCSQHDWRIGFHQTLPDFLPLYLRQGFKKLKIGDDAIVDLTRLTMEGRAWKEIRNVLHKLDRAGVTVATVDPPIPRPVLIEAKEVSDEWLRAFGRRERQFTLGIFEPSYIGSTPLFVARGPDSRILAFVNIIPSYRPGEATVDLMRRRSEAPTGTMDFLFMKLFFHSRDQGFTRFNFGMTPMSGIPDEGTGLSREERAIHAFFQRLNFLFSYRGLKAYKAKFASCWEPRYLIYRNVLDLPRLAIALGKITERRD